MALIAKEGPLDFIYVDARHDYCGAPRAVAKQVVLLLKVLRQEHEP